MEITAILRRVYGTPVFFCDCGIKVSVCTPISVDALTKQSLRVWFQDGDRQLRIGFWRHSGVNTNGKFLHKAGNTLGGVFEVCDGQAVDTVAQSDLNGYSFDTLLNSDEGRRVADAVVGIEKVRKSAVLSDLNGQLRTGIGGKAKGIHQVNLRSDQDNAARRLELTEIN